MFQTSEFETEEEFSRFTYRLPVKHIFCFVGSDRGFQGDVMFQMCRNWELILSSGLIIHTW